MNDSIAKIVAEMHECSIGNRHDAEMIDEWADRLDSLQQVPEGYVLVPRRLTAENGAKALLSGEFHELIQVPCSECDEDFDCEVCENEGHVTQSVPVSWDTIKCIHRMMVGHFASEATPAQAGAELPEITPCQHERTHAGYDYASCLDCGAFRTDSGWGIAKCMWFANREEAVFYRKNGRLPDSLTRRGGS